MASQKSKAANGRGLFEEKVVQLERRIRRQRALFIPHLLRKAVESNPHLKDESYERCYTIILKWADLETSGKLENWTETSVDVLFLKDVFGEGLGYADKTASPDNYQLENKLSVEGVGIADAAVGEFPLAKSPTAVVELKDAEVDLDRDRSQGRTAVRQCWDYLNALPDCPWGIVSNLSTIRLYHRDKGSLSYEEFTLQELRQPDKFADFYYLFERGGLLKSEYAQKPRALDLLKASEDRQRTVGDDLYERYRYHRLRLIDYLIEFHKMELDAAIHVAQKLLDRIIFIAFCEDRGLLNANCLERAWRDVAGFSSAKHRRWENFVELFKQVDHGGEQIGIEHGYNGSLFKPDPLIDEIELDDAWTDGFREFGSFDFSEEVNVEVLGHLFERSITELEKLRVGGLFALKGGAAATSSKGRNKKAAKAEPAADSKMPKSAQRKRFGIYYTPPAFTGLLVERTIDAAINERFTALQTKHGVDPDARENQEPKKLLKYWSACLETLKALTVCDPACGSGAFLIRAYDALDLHYKTVIHGLAGSGLPRAKIGELEDAVPDLILNQNIYGVDLSEQAVEISQLALWIRSARKNKKLSDLSKHIVWGNSLVSDAAVDPKALDWKQTFPAIFGKGGPGGFTCVIGNPPWERVKVQDREFFSLTDPQTAEAVSANDRKKRIAAMPKANPDLHASYVAARDRAQKMLDYARKKPEDGGRFPLTGKGDVNLYMLFAELAHSLVGPDGLVGILVPSGIATDDTTKEFFSGLMDEKRLVSLYDFENRDKVFEDVDGRFKFTALVFGGGKSQTEKADFVFFAHSVEETAAHYKQRHISLSGADMALLNPNTRTCPIFRSRRDADLTKAIYKHVPILIDENRKLGGNPWGIKFLRMFDQTNDAEHFREADLWEKKGYKLEGNVYVKDKKRALPLYEAKMVQAFDHRAASVTVDEENWVRQGQKEATVPVQHANPEFAVQPRWWVSDAVVDAAAGDRKRGWFLAYKDITSATNERTMIAAFLPRVAVVNSAPLVIVGEEVKPRRECCLLANLDSTLFDFVARQKVGSVHLNFFIVEQLPTLPPEAYADKCPWSPKETLENWISERVLKLSCTADDMIPLAKACDFKGSRGDGVHIWKESERLQLRAELDAAYFRLYGINRADAEYILSTFSNTGLLDFKGQQFLWKPGSIGELILQEFDRLDA